MYSHYWNTGRSRRPDYRRFTVVEGETPLPLGSTCRRKRLRSVGEDDEDEVPSCASRPNPEGSGAGLSSGEPEQQEKEEAGLLPRCQRCHIMASQLNRQAAAMADTAALKDPVYASFLLDKLQRLQWPRRGRQPPADACCQVCGSSFQQLRRAALRRALGLGGAAMTPDPPAAAASGDQLPPRWSYDETLSGGWGGVQSTYLGGGGAKRLATVTPLPLKSQHDLEGVWRVSCRTTKGATSDVGHVTEDTKPAAQSVGTQTSQTPSAATAFFIRAAQKLSLSRRKKSRQGPPSPPSDAQGPQLYAGGFSGALELSPPAVPPCLLRAGSKVKDTPGMGKVRVMIRICSANRGESPESTSFLKVDGRKKQLNVCEVQRRSSSSAPKTFAFDAIFPPDASQAEVCSGTLVDVVQSVVNGADGCIFCYGHANLGKTYTMIGRDCSTQSLGVAPTAISWLFAVLQERKEKVGSVFGVRVSAVEIWGRDETLSDLLADLQHDGPAATATVSLQEDPVCGSQLQNQTELRAPSAERAAFFLDAALAARRSSQTPNDQEARRNSHFLFTLHLYQERLDKSNKAAVSGRSRLHLLDLGSCETDISRTREGGGARCLSLSALGNVVLALVNGAKHVPYRDSKLAMLLSESLGNINCRTTMIAHVSDSPLCYMETLTTVQLAARIHRTRKKKLKYGSSSSGGESSCEEGSSRRPPHLRPFYPRTVALDPDTPLLLSSDPEYSSSSEHSCDTVIYIGPGGAAISDRELSDNEGPPSFVPIIPSLNKRRVKDGPRSDGDHFKCNTFAELQERLDCIDGSESPAAFGAEAKTAQAPRAAETMSDEKPKKVSTTACTNRLDKGSSDWPLACNSSKRTSADGEKLPDAAFQPCGSFSQDSEPVVREKVHLTVDGLRSSASPSLTGTSRAAIQSGEAVGRAPPLGMSQQMGRQRLEAHRYPTDDNNVQAAQLARCLITSFLRTTVTLQQPVELNREDELVFTVVEELPHGIIPDNGRPANVVSLTSDFSLRSHAPVSRPVSIISSINDEYDAYTTEHASVGSGADVGTGYPETSYSRRRNVGSGSGEVSDSWDESESVCATGTFNLGDKNSTDSAYHRGQFLQHNVKHSSNNGSFSKMEGDPAARNKLPTKFPPASDASKATGKGSRLRANTLTTSVSAHSAHHTTHFSLPRKPKATSSASLGGGRQEGRQDDPGELEGLSKQLRGSNVPFKRPGGNSNSVPRPPKAQVSSMSLQRVVDGCEKSGGRRGDALIKVPRLTRGATTLGTVANPQSYDLKGGHDNAATIGSLRFSSLGKKSSGQRSCGISRSGSGSISPPVAPVRQSSHEQKIRAALSPSALKPSFDIGKSLFPKTSTSVEESNVRPGADSFSHRSSSLKIDHARTSSSLKKRVAKGDSCRYQGSLASLERSDSQTQGPSGENNGANFGSNNKSGRTAPRLGVTAPAAIFPGAFKGNMQATGSLKVRSLSPSSSKSPSSAVKPDNPAGRNNTLPPKSPGRSLTPAKQGRGAVTGAKQVVTRAANNRVSELATVSERKQLGSGRIGSEGPGGSSAISPIPSPYSKITAPRRPQHYSSGHGSDNSSVLSGELPPAMGRTALFYHSGGSSGYESMIRDSETTGSTSSAHDSMSESGVSSSSRSRVSKSPKKRGNGFQRRRLIPVPLPDPSTLTRKAGGQWVDRPPPGGSLKDAFEIKVYEIDDVQRLQRRRDADAEPFQDVEKGLLYFNARLRMLERRQQQIQELKAEHECLQEELKEAKRMLMLEPDRWSGEFDVDQELDQESQDYLEALAQVTADLQDRVDLCKARVMMETCFDIATATSGQRGAPL